MTIGLIRKIFVYFVLDSVFLVYLLLLTTTTTIKMNNLSRKQQELLLAIYNSNYQNEVFDGVIGYKVWLDSVIDDVHFSPNETINELCYEGLAICGGIGTDATISITDIGYAAIKSIVEN